MDITNMKQRIIAIASGKGGTGKTTVAASLAYVIKGSMYVDCDVEEPNGHLMLHVDFENEKPVYKMLPNIDSNLCTMCNTCVEVCEFNALINLKTEIVLVHEMCHGCGACSYFCPEKAITEIEKEIGVVRKGISGVTKNTCYDGLLNIGEATAVPLINAVRKNKNKHGYTFVDAPPGTSCSMVEAVKDSDFCILVTESTPFGLNDLKLAVEVLRLLKIPFGVIINKHDPSFEAMDRYLNDESIQTLLKIPFDKNIAEHYSRGVLPVAFSEELAKAFKKIPEKIEHIISNENTMDHNE